MTGEATRVAVDYRVDCGWHIFTSEDVPELLVAHTDPLVAFNDVAVVLEGLMRLNAGIDCKFAPEQPAEQFLADRQHVTHRVHFSKAA